MISKKMKEDRRKKMKEDKNKKKINKKEETGKEKDR